MPDSVQTKIREQRADTRKRKTIADWEQAGRPVPPPHEVKQIIIADYKSRSGCNILVETGTYLGYMVEAQRKNFSRIYSIELGMDLWKDAVKKFEQYKHITILQGDSGKVLGSVVKELKEPAIFWLDGHYSAGITAKGDKECPIFEEISSIFKTSKFNHVLLVDDARCFVGEGDYPTIDVLTEYVKGFNPAYKVEVADDVIRYTVG